MQTRSDQAVYWDYWADRYQEETWIDPDRFHYGPLLPGDEDLGLLPSPLAGLDCLELGAGAGQNSMYLATQGARCVATDVSRRQLAHGRRLARQLGRSLRFQRVDIDALDQAGLPLFDLVHSTYCLPFAQEPLITLASIAGLVKPGGYLLMSSSHPAFAGEWLRLDEDEEGVFLESYFEPRPDVRISDDGENTVVSQFISLPEVVNTLVQCGFHILRVEEPPPPLLDPEDPGDARERVPYGSPDWLQMYPMLRCVPVVYIIKAQRPAEP